MGMKYVSFDYPPLKYHEGVVFNLTYRLQSSLLQLWQQHTTGLIIQRVYHHSYEILDSLFQHRSQQYNYNFYMCLEVTCSYSRRKIYLSIHVYLCAQCRSPSPRCTLSGQEWYRNSYIVTQQILWVLKSWTCLVFAQQAYIERY